MTHDPNATPHRPPKYVEGVYKPHHVTPDADHVVFVYPLDPTRDPHVADVDDTGCVRYPESHDHYAGKPIGEGGTTLIALVRDGSITYLFEWADRIDTDAVEAVVADAYDP